MGGPSGLGPSLAAGNPPKEDPEASKGSQWGGSQAHSPASQQGPQPARREAGIHPKASPDSKSFQIYTRLLLVQTAQELVLSLEKLCPKSYRPKAKAYLALEPRTAFSNKPWLSTKPADQQAVFLTPPARPPGSQQQPGYSTRLWEAGNSEAKLIRA